MNQVTENALDSLSDNWQRLTDLPGDFIAYETCCHFGAAEHRVEPLYGANNQPKGSRSYFRRAQA